MVVLSSRLLGMSRESCKCIIMCYFVMTGFRGARDGSLSDGVLKMLACSLGE